METVLVNENPIEKGLQAFREIYPDPIKGLLKHEFLAVAEELMNIILNVFELRMAWIGIVKEETYLVEPIAYSGFEEDYLKSIKVTWSDSEFSRGPTGQAIKTLKPTVQNNIDSNPAYKTWREQALRRGYRSSAAFPLISPDGRCLGALNLYSPQPSYFDEETVHNIQVLLCYATTVVVARGRTYLNEMLSALRSINKVITTESDRDVLLNKACEILHSIRGYSQPWIILFDENGFPISTHTSGLEDETNLLFEKMRSSYVPPCMKTALAGPDVLTMSKHTAKCKGCFLNEEHKDFNIASIRLEHNDKIYGVLTLAKSGDVILQEETSLFKEVYSDISYALHNMDVLEEKKNAEQRVRGLIYRLNGISPGKCYMQTSNEEVVFKIFADLILHDVPGLCFTRENPQKLVSEYGINKECIRVISSKPLDGFEAVRDIQALSLLISEFLELHKNSIVLLDGLEYLISHSSFDSVFHFIQEKRFDFIGANAVLLIPLDPVTLTEKECALLASELEIKR